jgi:hypothetical protein
MLRRKTVITVLDIEPLVQDWERFFIMVREMERALADFISVVSI